MTCILRFNMSDFHYTLQAVLDIWLLRNVCVSVCPLRSQEIFVPPTVFPWYVQCGLRKVWQGLCESGGEGGVRCVWGGGVNWCVSKFRHVWGDMFWPSKSRTKATELQIRCMTFKSTFSRIVTELFKSPHYLLCDVGQWLELGWM